MNVLSLLDDAEVKLQQGDILYCEKADIVMAILRSKGALPFKRASLNGGLHKLFSAALVNAHEAGTTIDIPTRRAQTLHELGYSTKVIEYLDNAVKHKLLLSQSKRAEGKLTLGDILSTYLNTLPASQLYV